MRVAVVTLLATLVSLLTPGPAQAITAAGPVATMTAVTVPDGFADTAQPVGVTLADATGTPVAGANVVVERLTAASWQPVATVVTDAAGRAATTAELSRIPEENVFRGRYAGDPSYAPSVSAPVNAVLVRRGSVVRLAAPRKFVDGRNLTLGVKWRTGHGVGVEGEVRIQERRRGRWRTLARVTTDARGKASVRLRPRRDLRVRARAQPLPWVEGARSATKRVDNRPPGPRVRLPVRAPRPRITLPPQPRAQSPGPHVTVTPIPARVWRSMVGRSWHPGCPVGRDGLRLVRSNYYDFSGYRRRGELVVAASAAGQFAGALRELHAVPIRAMYRVDRFGWSSRLRGADDYRSMAAGNTSAFNCRDVVGRPGVRSPHSYGRAFDLNTWENPYLAGGGWLPNRWWVGRSHPRVAWRTGTHVVVRILRRHGFSWTYRRNDAQHFDARTPSGRVLGRCVVGVCM